jgi:membrane associated rhomboid family serine protease/Zn-finger nucleic acid-binding protein
MVDICPHCGGIWFDPGELYKYLETFKRINEISPPALPAAVSAAATAPPPLEALRSCPRCLAPMQKYNYSYNSNIFLDRCPQCQGIWADQNEIQKIARFNKGNPAINELGASITLEQKDFAQNIQSIEDLAAFSARVPVFLLFLPKIILPLSDDNPRRYFPWVTLSLIAVNMAVFLAQFAYLPPAVWPTLFQGLGVVPAAVMRGELNSTLISALFLHSSLFHLAGNMFFLWLFGDNVEESFGPVRFLFFYLLCGILANLGHIFFNQSSTAPLIGASGAISGIMGAYLVLYPKIKVKTLFFYKVIDVPAYIFFVGWLGLQIFNGIVAGMVGHSQIAWWAHFAGFAAGAFLVYFFKTAKIGLRTETTA